MVDFSEMLLESYCEFSRGLGGDHRKLIYCLVDDHTYSNINNNCEKVNYYSDTVNNDGTIFGHIRLIRVRFIDGYKFVC